MQCSRPENFSKSPAVVLPELKSCCYIFRTQVLLLAGGMVSLPALLSLDYPARLWQIKAKQDSFLLCHGTCAELQIPPTLTSNTQLGCRMPSRHNSCLLIPTPNACQEILQLQLCSAFCIHTANLQ